MSWVFARRDLAGPPQEIAMDDLFPMLLSAVLGTLVGLQRQMAHKPAGLRTHTLVCIGSTMFLLVAPHAIRSFGMASFDPTRIVHGVVAGVGFLGAGAIMRTEQQVHGLTTAASIWIVAAIGGAVGARGLRAGGRRHVAGAPGAHRIPEGRKGALPGRRRLRGGGGFETCRRLGARRVKLGRRMWGAGTI